MSLKKIAFKNFITYKIYLYYNLYFRHKAHIYFLDLENTDGDTLSITNKSKDSKQTKINTISHFLKNQNISKQTKIITISHILNKSKQFKTNQNYHNQSLAEQIKTFQNKPNLPQSVTY